MMRTDTHCHLHDAEFFSEQEAEEVYKQAVKDGLTLMLGAATSLEDSRRSIAFSENHEYYFAAVGIHPHDATDKIQALDKLATLLPHPRVVAIGECGLDFYYNDRRECLGMQEKALRAQIELALTYDLPISFHVREAFSDFWPLFDSYQGIRGVLHSFTDTQKNLEEALSRNLSIGINGIATFTTHSWQRELFKSVPLEKILIETDAPFLTPKPFRGKINTPSNVINITDFLAELRGEDVKSIVSITTRNAAELFGASFNASQKS